nr:unnamed protein product [Callosobruchus analis]
MRHFRISRELTEHLADRFAQSHYFHYQEGDSEKVTPLKCVTIFLWFAENEAEQSFREKHFPGVIGVVDDSHIRIDKPNNDPESYFIRKKFHSIQVQAVCDHKKKN